MPLADMKVRMSVQSKVSLRQYKGQMIFANYIILTFLSFVFLFQKEKYHILKVISCFKYIHSKPKLNSYIFTQKKCDSETFCLCGKGMFETEKSQQNWQTMQYTQTFDNKQCFHLFLWKLKPWNTLFGFLWLNQKSVLSVFSVLLYQSSSVLQCFGLCCWHFQKIIYAETFEVIKSAQFLILLSEVWTHLTSHPCL